MNLTQADLAAADRLRHRMVDQLTAAGDLRSPEWRAAFETVPRHLFVPEFFVAENPPDGSPTIYHAVSAARSGIDRWLDLAYADEALVTQLDGRTTPTDSPDAAPVNAVPTSSASMPSVVALMLEHLDVADGDRILEIGTGTGYSTALGCHRLGDDNVTSVEVDPDVADRARAALAMAGHRPDLIIGDGLLGAPGRAPFDRVIATCSVRHIPPAWIAQCRPGAVIVAPVLGSLWSCPLAKLTVTDPAAGLAEGRFVSEVSFMPARAHAADPVTIPDPAFSPLGQRPAAVGPEVLSDQSGLVRIVVQLAAPGAQHVEVTTDDPDVVIPPHLLVAPDDSYVGFTGSAGSWTVSQGGPVALWDAVESAVLAWHAAGEPGLADFRITVTPEQQVVTFADHVAGVLPL